MKNATRALRRFHNARRKRWVRKNLRHYFSDPAHPDPRRVGLYADTPKPCSCSMCGNPRRYFGEVSMREKRAVESESLAWSPEDSVEVNPEIETPSSP